MNCTATQVEREITLQRKENEEEDKAKEDQHNGVGNTLYVSDEANRDDYNKKLRVILPIEKP